MEVEEMVEDFKEVKEGKAAVLYPASESVFYNPVQQFNRDLSILTIKEFIEIYKQEYETKNHIAATKQLGRDCKESSNQSHSSKNGDENSQLDGRNVSASNSNEAQPASSVGLDSKEERAGKFENISRPIRILEGLAATGLRSIRYALEINGIDKIIANDFSAAAFENIKRNIKHNNIGNVIEPSLSDAGLLMYQNKHPLSKRFTIIDIDPYGSPASFLDGAVQAVDDGGLLCITCTDMAGLCGNHGEASFAKYGAMPLKSKCCHEIALRLVLASIDSHAGRYKRHITPLLSISADFYIRLFVRVNTSASEVKRSASKKSYIFQCIGCDSFHLQPVGKRIEEGQSRKYNPSTGPIVGTSCVECGQRFQIGGPVWSEPIHDKSFVDAMLKRLSNEKGVYGTSQRLEGMLTVISEELDDCPLYYVIDKLANVIHCSVPSMLQFRSALISLGFNVSSTHANSNGLKTNAPNKVLWDVLRCWEKIHPVSEKKKKSKNSPAAVILSKEPEIMASFDVIEEANPKSRKMRMSRFPENPEPDWGPKARAKGSGKFSTLAEKRKQLQGKKTKRKDDDDYLKKFPCKKFKRGACPLTDQECKYDHKGDGLDDEKREYTQEIHDIEKAFSNTDDNRTSNVT